MRSPGHRDRPEHQVREERPQGRVTATAGGVTIADTRDVIRVVEDGHLPRYYFPRADVQMNRLKRTESTSVCPFKGKAGYFSIQNGDSSLVDAAWSYEDPYDEHRELRDRIAFYHERIPGLVISPPP